MKIKPIIFLLLFFAISKIVNGQNSRTISQTNNFLYAIDNIIFDNEIKKDSINKSTMTEFRIFNVLKSEWIKIDRYDFYYQPKMQEAGISKSNTNKLSKEIIRWFCILKPGDVLYLIAYAKINGINTEIQFSTKVAYNTDMKIIIKPAIASIIKL